MTDPLGQSQVLPYLCNLSKLDYSITLISCEKPARYKKDRTIIEQLISTHDIEWHPVMYTKWPPILSTVKDLAIVRRKAYELHKKKIFSLVHCRGHIPSLIGLYLKRRFGLRFLFDMRGFWADEKVDGGAWNLKNPLFKTVYGFFKKREKEFIAEADHIVCLTHRAFSEMMTWENVLQKQASVTVIPCCVDDQLFNPETIRDERIEALRLEMGIDNNDCVISYLGSIGTWYMLDEMLDFFIGFRKKVPESKFLFITQDEHEKIRKLAREKGIEKFIIIRPASRAHVPEVLSISSYSVFFIRPSYSKISSSPTKQAEIMAMGIPVVCNMGIGDTDMIVNKYHSGVLITGLSEDGYEIAVNQLASDSFDPIAIRKGAVDFFSLKEGVRRYARIYEQILQ